MSYAPIPETTFGNTPAAMYLARKLNEMQDVALLRSTGRRITATFHQTKQLVAAYEQGTGNGGIDTKTLANCLRLMREEITNEIVVDKVQYKIIHQLRRNVQIGHIKRAIRLATIARKAERVMSSPDAKASDVSGKALGVMVTELSYYFTDSQSNKKYLAGVTISDEADESYVLIHKFKLSDVETITPELLHERSERRCIRLKKPHTILHGNTP
jgi:hypothetical protein